MDADDFGKRMNSIPKYVVSATLSQDEATWGETATAGPEPAQTGS